ncbi:LPXTG cell wall anchor domain-containing protein [Embleya sp. AB8]|uniref:LPXTG cell wall anchor domain-containing protein n=1 Tax=Embleya sp. AB8 TaxID=3156304 RepID=UPI003C743BC4
MTLDLNNVPSTVTRGETFESRMTITNITKQSIDGLQIGIALELSGDGTHAKSKDFVVRYTLPGRSPRTLTLTDTEALLLGTVDLPDPLRAGEKVVIGLSVTVETSTPSGVTSGSINPWVFRIPATADVVRTFKIVGATPTTTAEPTSAPGTTPVTTPPATTGGPQVASLPKTGGATALPLLLSGGVLVVVGGTALVTARRRRTH